MNLILKFMQTYVHVEVMRWVLVGVIGVITGIVAFLISIIDKYLTNFKLNLFERSNSQNLSECINYCADI